MKYIGFPVRFLICFGVAFPVGLLLDFIRAVFLGFWPMNATEFRNWTRRLWRDSRDGF